MFKNLRRVALFCCLIYSSTIFSACSMINDGKRIIRISHGQSVTHPQHIGLLAFEEHIESHYPDEFDIQIFPNELLGSSVKAIELVQTGAIDYAVVSTSNLETFNDMYQIFSMPYLFDSVEAYHTIMNHPDVLKEMYESTEKAGFMSVTWFDAGTRNFYAKTPIYTPEDLAGKKIRVQASPTNIKMMDAFNAAATPLGFGEVYTAIQQNVIDGAENNELALTNNKHGEIAKYYTYSHHQMVPDMLVGNVKLLESLTAEQRNIFDEATRICSQIEIEAWGESVLEAKKIAQEDMGVEFVEVDILAFKEKVLPLHDEILNENPKLKTVYDAIQTVNTQIGNEGE